MTWQTWVVVIVGGAFAAWQASPLFRWTLATMIEWAAKSKGIQIDIPGNENGVDQPTKRAAIDAILALMPLFAEDETATAALAAMLAKIPGRKDLA